MNTVMDAVELCPIFVSQAMVMSHSGPKCQSHQLAG